MKLDFIRDVGTKRYVKRRFDLGNVAARGKGMIEYDLPNGICIQLPYKTHSAFSTVVWLTEADVDWGSEAILASYLKERAKTGEWSFFDVGAHIGYYSLYMAKDAAKIFAFEPDPRNVPVLEDNAWRSSRVKVVKSAVSDFDGVGDFDISVDSCSSRLAGKTLLGNDLSFGGVCSVEVLSLCNFYANTNAPPPAAVKIDISGHDLRALHGAESFMYGEHRAVFLMGFGETQEGYNRPEELADLLKDTGYSIYAVVKDLRFIKTRTAKFLKLEPEQLDEVSTKMLFLAPDGDPFFEAMIGELQLN